MLTKGLTFDDISLVPRYSTVASRHEVSLACGYHFGHNLKVPILSANMRTVTGVSMCEAMERAGGLGVLHRFQSLKEMEDIATMPDRPNMMVSIGVDDYKDRLELYNEYGFVNLCIDVAHGHHAKMANVLNDIRSLYGDRFFITAGNVCTAAGAKFLVKNGADTVKVGVGPGSHCTTRVVTGHGVPQFTAIQKIRHAVEGEAAIIADGGIRNAGDIAKAIVAGADYVMIGRLLAGCAEAPSEAVMRPDGLKKVYRGSASYEAQISRRDKRTIIAEGVQSEIPYTGTVEQVVTKLSNGLKSACSYSGARTLNEFKEKAQYIEVTGASFVEGTPHGAM